MASSRKKRKPKSAKAPKGFVDVNAKRLRDRFERVRKQVQELRRINRELAKENRELAGPGWRDLNRRDLYEMISRGTPRQRSIAKREIFRREPLLRQDPHAFAQLLLDELGLKYGEGIQLFFYG